MDVLVIFKTRCDEKGQAAERLQSTRQQDEALGHNSSMDFFTNGITTRRRNESAGKRAQMGSSKSSSRDLTDKQNHNHDGRAEDTEQQPSSDLNNSVFSPEPQTRQERARSTFSHSMEKSKRRRRRLNSSMATGTPIVDLPQQIAYHGANYHSKNKGETDHHGIEKNKSFDKKHSGNCIVRDKK